MLKISILDGYVDEPTCLGVPPYISPYPRYIAGAIKEFDKKINVSYFTIDQVRNDSKIIDFLAKNDIVVTITGMSTPGRYLSGFPAGPNEIKNLMSILSKPMKILLGPAAKYGFGVSGGKKTRMVEDVFDLLVKGDGEIVIYDLLKNRLNLEKIDPMECRRNAGQIRGFAIKGSEVVKQHPFYPHYLIAEIETYRGCPRSIVGGCSFCSEPSKGLPDFRDTKDIIDEIKTLYHNGVRHFRLGNQPCIFSYMAKDACDTEFPRPNPDAVKKLFKGIRDVAPLLKTLHIDNANPGIIARYPRESEKIAKTIVQYHTPGDVAALGVESVDPIVIHRNNLKASSDEVLSAVKLLNKIGRKRGVNGMPEFLPGLNFVFGLDGETKNTYNLDFEFLKEILDQGLLVRRINLRQVIPIPNTKMYNIGSRIITKNKSEFKKFKRKVRKEIEQPMLEKLLPRKTVLKDVYTEKHEGKLTFGRQIGSYPLLVGIPGVYELNNFIDVKIVGYGYRSVTGVPYPLNINNAKRETLEAIPGIGKKRAIRILEKRPFNSEEQLHTVLDDADVASDLLEYIRV